VTSTGPHQNWSELASLIDALLDAAPEQRASLIAELSGGDPVRRSELERLLAECELEPSLFSRPAAERFAALFDDDVARFPEALADRYRLTTQLGRGGMATVYLARDLKHARDVAVKVVYPVVASALGADLFLREIEIVAQLHHPHIVPLFDSGEADGSLYYVMPYEAGSSLRRRMALEGPLPLEDVVLILRDVCDALAHAHRHGIVHRDIKPDNVILEGEGSLKLIDLGVVRIAGMEDFPPEEIPGTPAYMAPEMLDGEPGSEATDIYALGVTMFRAFTGEFPYGNPDATSPPRRKRPIALCALRPDLPAWLQAALGRAIRVVELRFVGVDELAFGRGPGFGLLAA